MNAISKDSKSYHLNEIKIYVTCISDLNKIYSICYVKVIINSEIALFTKEKGNVSNSGEHNEDDYILFDLLHKIINQGNVSNSGELNEDHYILFNFLHKTHSHVGKFSAYEYLYNECDMNE